MLRRKRSDDCLFPGQPCKSKQTDSDGQKTSFRIGGQSRGGRPGDRIIKQPEAADTLEMVLWLCPCAKESGVAVHTSIEDCLALFPVSASILDSTESWFRGHVLSSAGMEGLPR